MTTGETKHSPSVNHDTGREFFRKSATANCTVTAGAGVTRIHHADCHCANIVKDIAEIGEFRSGRSDPDTDLGALQKELDGSTILMGGINAEIDRSD